MLCCNFRRDVVKLKLARAALPSLPLKIKVRKPNEKFKYHQIIPDSLLVVVLTSLNSPNIW